VWVLQVHQLWENSMDLIAAIGLLISLVVGAPDEVFAQRWPYAHQEMRQLHWRQVWPHLFPRKIDPPGEHYRMGKGELIGRCWGVSEIGVRCRWERARV
jgi:hypothetical protein